MKASFLIAATTVAVVLVGCGPPMTWFRPETSASLAELDLADCRYQAFLATPPADYSTSSASRPPPSDFYSGLGQGLGDAGETIGAAVGHQAHFDQLTQFCMEARAYALVPVDSDQARAMSEYVERPEPVAQVAGGGEPASLLLFGGENRTEFIGCLSCSRYDDASVLNRYGEHGSPYSDVSIHNRYGDYGSRYSEYSACNPYASDPPVVVDSEGNYYGRLTVDEFNPERFDEVDEVLEWLQAVCNP
jgi:hypothetical protein